MELTNWFKGFEKGIARISPEQRSVFFAECGKNCVKGGTLSVYQKLYEDAKGDFWNALVNCAKKDMSQHLCSVNVRAKA